MTETKQSETKIKPAFYVFQQNAEGVSEKVGAVFKHSKGGGFNIVIGDLRFVAFPPKQNQPE